MTSVPRIIARYAILLAYPVGILVFLHYFPRERTVFAIVGCCCFYLLYILPFVLFSADVAVTNRGLLMKRIRTTIIPFSEISVCVGVFLIPFQLLVLLARRGSMPIIAITFDSLLGPRRSIFQAGELVAAINERRRRISRFQEHR